MIQKNMKKIKIIVGFFFLVGLFFVFFLSFRVGKDEFIGPKTYELHAMFSNISGVPINGRVEISGVKVGSVKSITLNDNFKALVTIEVPLDLTLEDDTIALVKTSGLIGDRFIELMPGASGVVLNPGISSLIRNLH